MSGNQGRKHAAPVSVTAGVAVPPMAKSSAAPPPKEPITYRLRVDSEGKAKQLKLWSIAPPHMLAFWVACIGFNASFAATFAPAPLLSIIRQDLNLTRTAASCAAIASITGTAFARLAMGSVCDAFGPRFGMSMLLSLTSVAAFNMSMVTTSAGFIIARCCIGFSLACFVCNQFWTSIMFSPTIVGTANAFAGGIGNSGGGITHIIMPAVTVGISHYVPLFEAWRWAFFVAGSCQVLISALVLLAATDLPTGNYSDRPKAEQHKPNVKRELVAAFGNYRTWVLMICYAFSFGVELTVNNNLPSYLQSQFGYNFLEAGVLSSVFGLMNLISRPMGGMASDFVAKHYGMRGRLFLMWGCLASGPAFCIALGFSQHSIAMTMVFIVLFAACVQAGCGGAFSIVPFVSRRALGLVCGAVGAGGSLGSAVLQAAFFTTGPITAQNSYKYMGATSLIMTLSAWTLWFPMWGGMLWPAREGATEQEYYYRDWTEQEQNEGKHLAVMKFANESRSQRGILRLKQESQSATAISNGYHI